MKRIKGICMVDDDEIFRFLTSEIIQQTQLVERILSFDNGREALEFLTKESANPERLPEVILLDLNMPVMDGWEFLDEYVLLLPRIGKKIVLYIVSSSISPKDILRAKTISAVSDYIIKPVTEEQVLRILQEL